MAFLDETGLSELWRIIGEKYDARAQIALGSYTGTGVYGVDNPTSITFDFEPKMVRVFYIKNITTNEVEGDEYLSEYIFARPFAISSYEEHFNNNYAVHVVSWNGNTVSWYVKGYSSYADAGGQLNEEGKTYHYFAIG